MPGPEPLQPPIPQRAAGLPASRQTENQAGHPLTSVEMRCRLLARRADAFDQQSVFIAELARRTKERGRATQKVINRLKGLPEDYLPGVLR